MALPKLDTPTFKLQVPSTGKTVSYRPFLVKEEKILLMARESKNTNEVIETLKKLVSACVDDTDPNKLTTYDLEYIFMMLRSKSIGEELEIGIKCEECGEMVPVSINIEEDIQITKTEMDSKIQLTPTVGVILRHPTVEIVSGLNTEDPMEVLMGCMESIYDDTTVHNLQEYSKKEIKDFVDALSIKEVQKIQDYFEAMPKLTCDVKFTCPSCGHENTVRVEGLSNFF